MQQHLLTDGKKEVWIGPYPENWDEMNRKQAIFVCKLLYWMSKGQFTVDQFRKLVVDRFIRRDNRGIEKVGDLDAKMAMWANEGLLADTVNFFFKIDKTEQGGEKYEVLPAGTTNWVKDFRFRFKKYYGPGDFLDGMTFAQFKDALTNAHKYMETQDDEWLGRLLAVCYLPKGEKYRMKTAMRRAKRFNKVDIGIRYACFCYLMGCMHTLQTDGDGQGIEVDGNRCRFSLVFGRKGGKKGGKSNGIGLTGVLMSLAESGVFGDLEKTADADVWDVLVRLYQLELDRREMERQLEKGRRK
jgi:hypothetical protein